MMDSFHCSPRIVSTPSEPSSTVISPGYRDTEKNSTLRDEAKLLLSIADIAKCEIAVCPFALLSEDDSYSSGRSSRSVCCPTFPVLHKGGDHNRGDTETSTATDSFLAPRLESLRGLLHSSIMSDFKPLPGRLRAVSIDTPSLFLLDRLQKNEDMPSPLAAPPTLASVLIESSFAPLEKAGRLRHSSRSGSKRTTPTSMSHTSAVPRSMLSHKARRERFLEVKQKTCHTRPATSASSSPMTVSSIPVTPPPARKSSSKSLQGKPGEGVPTKKIFRRKFSWKNYPELERFLVTNRETYLRHSALNYTLQQKQYNNRLTDDLLVLATKHGYMFDEKEFGFVTVRDRIRCYYKSFVQSAKKRGVLMGYAARKAGLLDVNLDENDDDDGDLDMTMSSDDSLVANKTGVPVSPR